MKIYESIRQEPEKWSLGEHHFFKEGGPKIWVANGLLYCAPTCGSFGFIYNIRIWLAYRWWCKNAPIDRLKG